MEIKIPTDKQIGDAFGNANLDSADPVELAKSGLLKISCGYSTGHTVLCVLQDLRLVKKSAYRCHSPWKLTKQGGLVLFEWYSRRAINTHDRLVEAVNNIENDTGAIPWPLWDELQTANAAAGGRPKFRCCIVKDCDNSSENGRMIGNVCSPCHEFITQGTGAYSKAYFNAVAAAQEDK